MKVVVVGAGVTGVTLAWELCQRGHEVTVVEALNEAAEETSRANAAQRSYGAVYPWASPALMTLALRTFFSKDSAFKLALPPSPETLAFLFRTLKHALTPGRFEANREAMLRLAEHSRQCFLALEDELGDALIFDGEHRGVLELASTDKERERLGADTAMLERLGIEYELLDAAGVRRYEPALDTDAPLAGGLRLMTDGTGDCYQFTQSLAQQAAAAGVTFRYNKAVTQLAVEHNSVKAVVLDQGERLNADAVVLCAGFASRRLPAARFEVMQRALHSRFPDATAGKVEQAWAGFRPMTPDGPPLLGASPDGRLPNLYFNTGHGTFGWTLSAGSANWVARHMDGEPMPAYLRGFSLRN